jgi:hypothetical protein
VCFRAASGDPDVTIVFRGVPPGETLTGVVRRLGERLEGIEPKPKVAIHPKSFRDHRVTSVPTIVEAASGKTIRGTLLARPFVSVPKVPRNSISARSGRCVRSPCRIWWI